MPRDHALTIKALDWMRRHRPEVDWSRADADHLIRLFDAELIKRASDGRGVENRKELLHHILKELTPIRPQKPAVPQVWMSQSDLDRMSGVRADLRALASTGLLKVKWIQDGASVWITDSGAAVAGMPIATQADQEKAILRLLIERRQTLRTYREGVTCHDGSRIVDFDLR